MSIDDVLIAVRDWLKAEGLPTDLCRVQIVLRNQNEAALANSRALEQRRQRSQGALPDGVVAKLDGIEVSIGV